MKKLFSLILMALISSQMWAATYTASVAVGSGSGTVWIDQSSTSTSGSTSISKSSSTGTYYIHALPSAGYIFEKWTKNTGTTTHSSNNPSTSVTLASSSPYTYKAHFKAITITVNKNIAAGGTASATALSPVKGSGSALYTTGSTNLSATPSSGYKFKNWTLSSTSGTVLSTSKTYTYTGISSNVTIYANFEVDAPAEPEGPTAGAKVSYTATPGTNVMQQGPNVTIPNIANAVDLGFSVLWAKKDVGSAGVGYRGTKYTYSAAMALSAETLGGTGWRIPTYDELASSGLGALNTRKDGNDVAFTRNTGYNGVELIIACESAGATDIWSGPSTGSTNYYGRATKSSGSWTFPNGTSSASYEAWVRPVFDLAAASIKKLTINVVKDGVTTTNNYYVANNQQVDITPATVSGYNSSWTSGASGTGTKTFTVTSNTTATITYTEAITYVTATFNNYNGTQLAQYTNVVSGTTPTYSGVTPTRPNDQTESTVTTYTFTGWSPALGNITTNTTYTAQFSSSTSPRPYLIRFLMDDGETVIQSGNVAYGETPIAPADEDVTKIADESYTYAFAGWDANNDGVVDEVAEVTGVQDYVAVFTATPVVVIPTYNITVGAYSNGTVTLTAGGDVQIVPAEGGVYNYLEGTTIIVKAVANRGWHFTEWSDNTTNSSIRVRDIDENKTFTPTFAANTPFTMLDTWEYDDCMDEYDFINTLTVTLDGRTFTAGQWATLSVPFDYTLTTEDALYNMVYRLSSATLSSTGSSMSFEFVRSNSIEKNQPYLVVPRQAVNEVVFDGVKLETPAEQAPTTDNRVAFVSSLWKQTIHGRNEFYVGNNSTLRYASTSGTTIKGNRAFFRKIGDAASAPMRMIVRMDGVEQEIEITEDGDIQPVETTRKYMENGILVIERNGIRYDAQGKRID